MSINNGSEQTRCDDLSRLNVMWYALEHVTPNEVASLRGFLR